MGTRGTIAVRVNGVEKGAYNHFDSYLSELGETMLATAKKLADTTLRAKYKALAIELAPIPDARPTPEQIERLAPYTNLGVSEGSTRDWYCLLRETQGDLEKMLRAGLYEPFPVGDEEYSYVIDFDADTFEVYEGMDKTAVFPLDDLPESLRALAGAAPDVMNYG